MRSEYSNKTPDNVEVIRAVLDSVLLDLNVCLPAKIVKYNKDTQYADVEIQLYQKNQDDSLVKYPIIPMVPIKHPRAAGGKAYIHLPLKAGDDVTLIFSQRSLDNWKSQGGLTDPNDPRKHHLTDAFALIGGSAIPDAFKPETDNAIEITNQDSSLQIFPDGTFKMKNIENELIDLLSQTLDQLFLMRTNTIFGAQPPINLFEFEALKLKMDTLKGA